MKLFQQLLIAPAALGLMAPMAVNADELAGQFSSTTTLSGSAVFTTGSVSDGGSSDTEEELYMQYGYALELNSSFTGEDLLYAEIEAGNASGPLATLDSAIDAGDSLTVESLFYAFPVGELEVTFGPLVDQDDVIAATTSLYSDSYRHSSLPFSAAGDETGPGLGVAYANADGWNASFSFISVDGANSASDKGIGGDSADDVVTVSVGYDGDGFGGGVVLASNDGDGSTGGYDTFGGGIYWTPDSMPATVSVTYDTKDPETGEDCTDLFVGIEYEAGPGVLGAAYHSTDVDGGDASDETGYELTYTYDVNDNVSITPGIFFVEDTSDTGEDDTAVFVETVFNF